MPFFSIIIPVYNVAPYLRECLDSVLAQTFTDWEAICVDDGSTDSSGAILDEYAAKDNRFKVFHQKNAGVSAARNMGLDFAQGRIITFLDADDKISECWLAAAFDCFNSKDPDILRLRAQYWHTDGSLQRDKCGISDIEIRQREEIVAWAWYNLLYRGWSCVMFAKRETIGLLRFPDGLKIREDTIFVLGLMSKANVFIQGSFDGYFYRWHDCSAYNGSRTILESSRFPYALLEAWKMACNISPRMACGTQRLRIAKIIFGAFIEWLQRCDRREWRKDKAFRDALGFVTTAGVWNGFCPKGRWNVPYVLYRMTGSLMAFYCVQAVCTWVSGLKRRVARR